MLLQVVQAPEGVAASGGAPFRPATSLEDPHAELVVVPVALGMVVEMSTVRVTVPEDLRPSETRRSVLLTLRRVLKRYDGGMLPRIDPVLDMGIEDEDMEAGVRCIEKLEAALIENPIFKVISLLRPLLLHPLSPAVPTHPAPSQRAAFPPAIYVREELIYEP